MTFPLDIDLFVLLISPYPTFSPSINFVSTEYLTANESNAELLETFDPQVWIGAGVTLFLIFMSRWILTRELKSSLWWLVVFAAQKGKKS